MGAARLTAAHLSICSTWVRISERAVFPGLRHLEPYPLASRRAPVRLPHASRRPQNGESGDVPPSGRGLVARPAAEGLYGRAEDTTLHPAAPTPPPSADSPMHSTRAQDAAEPCIAYFRRSPSGLHEPKDEWLLPGENGHFATFLIISQPPILKRITARQNMSDQC